jgi:Ran GTPase-activating protein (RanGAP) involved in mRNA processing and transport
MDQELKDLIDASLRRQELKLAGYYIGAEGAIHVAEAIKVNSSLESINLTNNQIGDE